MKKLYAFVAFLIVVSTTFAQESHPYAPPSPARGMKFAADVVINNKPVEDQRNLRTASAFNGWLYAAYTLNDTLTGKGGISVCYSKNGGATWMKFSSYQFPNSYYPLTDITVAGTDTNNLQVYVAGVLKMLSNGQYVVYIDKFNGRNGNLVTGNVFIRSLGNRPVHDISIATDYLYPSSLATPYSIGFLYSHKGTPGDSLIFVASLNGGNSFGIRYLLAAANGSFGKVSLAYGRSPNYSGGSYYAAWEMFASANSTLGHIYTSHSSVNIGSSWLAPKCLDSLSATTNNLARHPVIACHANNVNNDSNNITALVTFERAYLGNTNDFDVIGYYNKRAQTGTTWNRFNIVSTTENDLQPAMIFDHVSNKFLVTYYDSTNGKLVYAKTDFQLTTPNSWNFVSMQYNDVVTTLSAPWPRIVLHPGLLQAAFVWVSEGNNQLGIALFDGEYSGITTNVVTNFSASTVFTVHPNPASEITQIVISSANSDKIIISIYDILGNEIVSEIHESGNAGIRQIPLDVSAFKDGIYFCRITDGSTSKSMRLVVQH